MKSSFLSFLVCTCLAVSSVFGTVINVPADYWSIQDAIDAAAEQDTVMIAPGTYYENLRMHHKAVNLIGSGGIDNPNTIIKPDSAAPLLSFDSNVGHALITGLTFDGSQFTCVYFCCAKATFTNNVFRYNAWASTTVPVIKIEEQNVFPIRIENNLFYSNKGNTCILAAKWGAAEVISNTFLYNQSGVIAGSDSITVVENNIIANSVGHGLLGTAVRSDCNDIYGNNPNYSPGLVPGPGDFSSDPVFCNADSGDFYLADGSPCAPGFNSCSVLVGAFDVNCVGCNDFDGDSLCSYEDNCPTVYNPDQSDIDGDGWGDVCDGCPTIPFESPIDFDGDAIPNDCDNCLFTANPSQIDSDGDGWGDECDYCVGFPCSTFCAPFLGSWSGNDPYDIDDYFTFFGFLYADSAGPPNPMNVDVDGKNGLTPGDLAAMRDHLFGGAPFGTCPPMNSQTAIIDSALRIEYVDSILAGPTSVALGLKIVIPFSPTVLTLPLRIRIGSDIPVLDSIVDGPEFDEYSDFSPYPSFNLRANPDSGEFLISAFHTDYWDSIQAGTYTVATLHLSFPSAPVTRPVNITWTEFGPTYPLQSVYDVIYNAVVIRKYYSGSTSYDLQYEPLLVPTNCCVGIRGNVDGRPDNIITISDLTYMVAYMFGGGPQPCLKEADINASGGVDVSDLTFLVAYMFGGGPEPASCS